MGETNKDKELGIELEKEVQYTPAEILEQMIAALIVAVQGRQMSGETAALMIELMRELLHWAFMKPGTHSTPSEILSAALQMNTTKQKSDA